MQSAVIRVVILRVPNVLCVTVMGKVMAKPSLDLVFLFYMMTEVYKNTAAVIEICYWKNCATMENFLLQSMLFVAWTSESFCCARGHVITCGFAALSKRCTLEGSKNYASLTTTFEHNEAALGPMSEKLWQHTHLVAQWCPTSCAATPEGVGLMMWRPFFWWRREMEILV